MVAESYNSISLISWLTFLFILFFKKPKLTKELKKKKLNKQQLKR